MSLWIAPHTRVSLLFSYRCTLLGIRLFQVRHLEWNTIQYELRHLEWGRNIQSMIFQGEMKLNRVEQIGYSKSILFWEDKNNLLCHTFSLRAEKIPNLKSIPGICQTLKSETYLEQVICQNVVLETSMKNLANSGIWSYKT